MRLLMTHTPSMRANYYGDRALAALRDLCEVRLHEGETVPEPAALAAMAEGCQIVLSDRQSPGTAAFFDAAPDVVAFLRCAVDIRTIDVEAASRNGVLVTRATSGFAVSVAEMALGFMLDLARGISDSVAAYRAGRAPQARRGRTLAGATLGIIGLGVIGSELARLAQALGMTVLAADPHRRTEAPGVRLVELPALLVQADFVVCLAPATPETENLMDAAAFAQMRPGACFLNLARGELVDDAALAAALDTGRIVGAALDVGRAPDQMPAPALACRADVLATPHVAGLTPEAVEHQAFDTVAQVRALVEGRLPEHAVNAARAHRLDRLGIAWKDPAP